MRRLFHNFESEVTALLNDGYRVRLDLRPLARLFPCGLLLFMGLVEHWVATHHGRISAVYPENDLVEQMLQQVSVLQKLGLSPRKQITQFDVTRWHYFTGTDVNRTQLEPFMAELGTVLDPEQQAGLGDCIAEAMTNVKHHAYAGAGAWWIFATITARNVTVAMYDRGLSIPSTLLEKPVVRDYLSGARMRGDRYDGRLIQSAAGGRTSTRLSYRGKGLPEMLDFASRSNNGWLGIYSRRGWFGNVGLNRKESFGTLETPIQGTLVLFHIGLTGNSP
jgi:hypothetical protein